MLAAEALAKDLGAKQVVVGRVPLVAALGLGVAAQFPVERAQPAADLGARVRRLELGLGGLGVVVERQLLQPAAEDAPGVEDGSDAAATTAPAPSRTVNTSRLSRLRSRTRTGRPRASP